jgi:hypothetical protein
MEKYDVVRDMTELPVHEGLPSFVENIKHADA